eukprot:scaffold5052_cov131-Isochrysis_galbana.AAC.3
MAHVLPHARHVVAAARVAVVCPQVAQHPRPHACRVDWRRALRVRRLGHTHGREQPRGRLGWEQPAAIEGIDEPLSGVGRAGEEHRPPLDTQQHRVSGEQLQLALGHARVDEPLIRQVHVSTAHSGEAQGSRVLGRSLGCCASLGRGIGVQLSSPRHLPCRYVCVPSQLARLERASAQPHLHHLRPVHAVLGAPRASQLRRRDAPAIGRTHRLGSLVRRGSGRCVLEPMRVCIQPQEHSAREASLLETQAEPARDGLVDGA